MYKLVVYKKSSGCSQCAVLDRLTPNIQKKYPEVAWEYVIVDPEEDNTLPSFVGGFPTSALYKDDEQVFVHPGYDGLAKKLHGVLNS